MMDIAISMTMIAAALIYAVLEYRRIVDEATRAGKRRLWMNSPEFRAELSRRTRPE